MLKNDCEKIDYEIMVVILRDKFGNFKEKVLIFMEDVNKVIKDGYNWVIYKKDFEYMVVVNIFEGRICLDEFIMNFDELMKVYYINLNFLDNRRGNLEIKEI